MDQIREQFLKWEADKQNQHYADLIQNIWEVYHPKLQVYCSQFYHLEENSDLVSDILLHVFESINSYKSQFSFSTWIYTVARNYIIDRLRRKTLHAENIDDHMLGNENTPESILLKNSEQEMVRHAVDLLKPADRELIYLHFYEKLKYREIARITGMAEGTIKYRMSENKKILKKNLQRSLAL